MRNFLRYLR